jgi:hypothetical protein
MLLRIGAFAIAITFILAISLLASSDDPTDGTWLLDVGASKFNPGPGPQSQARIYKADGKNIKMIALTIDAQGKQIHIEYAGAYDGKDYPVTGNPRVETIAQERIDFYTVKTQTKRGGKVTATTTRVISQDGKTMTITGSGTDEKGVELNNTLVLRKL